MWARPSAMPTLASDQWMVDPKGYAVLTACSLHEEAKELTSSSGDSRGALSYFLIDTLGHLRKHQLSATHEHVYEHLRIRFRAAWPKQTPMRYGKWNSSFFHQIGVPSGPLPTLIYRRGNCLFLDAGEAHGVHEGNEYIARRPFQSDVRFDPPCLSWCGTVADPVWLIADIQLSWLFSSHGQTTRLSETIHLGTCGHRCSRLMLP